MDLGELACVYVQRTSREMRMVRRAGEDCRRVAVKVGTERDVM